MLLSIKSLKIALPVATTTAATIATASLVSFKKEDEKLSKENKDQVLEDVEKPIEEFKEQLMLYSEEGKGENVTVDDANKAKELVNKANEEGLKDEGIGLQNKHLTANPEPSNKKSKNNEKQDIKTISDDVKSSLQAQENQDSINGDLGHEVKDFSNAVSSNEDSLQQPQPLNKVDDDTESGKVQETEPTSESVEGVTEKRDIDGNLEAGDNHIEGESTQISDNSINEEKNSDDSLRSDSEMQSTQNEISSDSSIGVKGGIKNEYESEEMSQNQIEEMIKLEGETASALVDLRKLLV